MFQSFQLAIENSWLAVLLTAFVAYLCGSVNFAVIISRLMFKEDVRTKGSGNGGATNMLRVYGKAPALLTLVGDLAKSFVAILCGGYLLTHLQLTGTAEISLESMRLVGRYLAGVSCVFGHLYPVFFGFRGGKGVLTSLGMILILDIRVALLCLAVFIITVAITRMVSLGSVLGEAVAPGLVFLFAKFVDGNSTASVSFCVAFITLTVLTVIIKHRTNIVRICKGTESKIHFSKKSDS